MKGRPNRVIIDTNLWVSFLLTKNVSKFDMIIADNQLMLVFSEELLDEFLQVVNRDKFRKYFDDGDIEALLLKIKTRAVFVKIVSEITSCIDPKDNFLLSLAIDANATHLITGDKDLLMLQSIGDTRILTITEYFSIL
jgi:putative PIN family toxin of toxin-antitoxin system